MIKMIKIQKIILLKTKIIIEIKKRKIIIGMKK